MFPAEPLHQVEQGVHGKHMWPWIKDNYLTPHELAVLDQKFELYQSFSFNWLTEFPVIFASLLQPGSTILLTGYLASLVSRPQSSITCFVYVNSTDACSDI